MMRPPLVKHLLNIVDDLSLLPFAGALVSRLSIYVTLIVAAHLLDGEQFGVYAVCLVIVGILSALVTGGGDMWLNRFTGQVAVTTGQAPRLWPAYFLVVLAISGFLTLGVLIAELTGLLPDSFAGLGLVTAMAAILVGLTEALLAVMRAGGAIRLFFIGRDILAPLVYLGLLVWFRPRTTVDALELYVGLWGTIFLAASLRILWLAPLMLPAIRPPRMAWAPVARHTLGLIYGNLTSRLAIYIDVLVLTGIVSMTALGEYRVAAQFAIGFMVVQHFVFLGLPWQMRSSGARAEPSQGLTVVAARQKVLIVVAALGGLAMWILARPLLGLLGDRFTDMAPVFRVLLLTRFVSLLWGPQHEILVSNSLAVEDAHANIVLLGTWIVVFSVALISSSVLVAAVAATVLAALAQHLYRVWLLRRYQLPEVYGHGLGPACPIILSLLTLLLAMWSIPL
jgi:O-antigen/teichoic acid export membrane protein